MGAHPADVCSLISDLSNSRVAFRLSGEDIWVKKSLCAHKNGISSVTPFNWTSPICTKPLLFGLCCDSKRDSWRNIGENGEFVINLLGENFGLLMHIIEQNFPYEISEIDKTNPTEMKPVKIRPPKTKEAFTWLECKMEKHFQIADYMGVVGKVLVSEAKYDCMEEVINVEKVKLASIGD